MSAVTTPGEGGWVWFGSCRAIASGNRTIAGYITGSGDVKAILIDNATKAVTATTTMYAHFLVDDHEPPSFVVRPDGVIMAAFAYHIGELYVGIGTAPGVLPAQAQVTNITTQVGAFGPVTQATGYTYASIVYLGAEDRYYIFFRFHDWAGTAHVGYTWHAGNGAGGLAAGPWAPRTLVATATYHQFAKNGTGRLDFVLSNHPHDPGNHDVRHMYFTGSQWYTSAGVRITAAQPFAITEATRVWDGSTTMGWLWDIAIDSGKPVVAFATFPGAANPGGPATDHRAYDGRWDGSAWATHQIAAMGSRIPTADVVPGDPESFYSGGVVIDHSDPTVMLYSSNTGGSFNLYRAVTTDGGATYTSTAVTSDGNKNVRPVCVIGHGTEVQFLYLYGRFDHYESYSQGIGVIGAAAPPPPPPPVSLQTLINATPTGGTLVIPDGVYHENVTVGRPMTIDGSTATIDSVTFTGSVRGVWYRRS